MVWREKKVDSYKQICWWETALTANSDISDRSSTDTVHNNNIFSLRFFFGLFCMSLFFVSLFWFFVCVCVFVISFLETKGIHCDTQSNMLAGKLEKHFCLTNFQKQDYLFFFNLTCNIVKALTIYMLKREHANLAHF